VVFEGAARLGPTPLTVMIDNGAVRVQPRRLEVRLDGYEPFTVDATPSDEAVRVVANLTPRAAQPAPVVAAPPIAAPAPAAAPRPAVARPSGRPSRPTLPHPPPDNDDIRAHR
jgi:serine/threonine-protein kinase